MREMKDSGIEWIGEIPRDWDLKPLKAILVERKENNDPIKTDFILSLTMEKGVIPYGEKNGGGNKAKEDLSAYKLAYENDIVINSMNVLAGSVGISKYFGCVSPVYYMLYPRQNNNTLVNFYNYLFQTKEFQASLFGMGNGIMMKESGTGKLNTIRMRIPMSKLNTVRLPVIDYATQQRIANYLDSKCVKIDTLIEKTKLTIEEYKKLKYAIVADAVKNGINTFSLRHSDVEWIGDIPQHWKVIKLKYLFSINKRIANSLEYDVLSVTQSGLKVKDLSNNEGQVASDYSKYQIVEPNDFVMNHMDLLTGWVDCSKYNGVTSPDYRVFTLDRIDICDRKYYTYIFQLCYKHKVFYGLGQGVSNLGRWRLQTDKFTNFELPVPPLEEQQAIADYLDKQCAEIDTLIEKKQTIVTELESYKKSLIYEFVTGKRKVAQAECTVIPFQIEKDKRLKAQIALMAKALDAGHTKKKFGRTEWFKNLYLLDACVGFPLQKAYIRGEYGPVLETNTQCEKAICKENKWFNNLNETPIKYVATKNKNNFIPEYESFFSSVNNQIEDMLKKLHSLSMNETEKIATLYAVWNDFIIEGRTFNDDDIVTDVLTNWSNRKKNFSSENWHNTLNQMRRLGIIPKGYGKHTVKGGE